MSSARGELQYRIALGILGQMRSAGFVTDQEAETIRRLAGGEISSGNCSGIVMDIPPQVW